MPSIERGARMGRPKSAARPVPRTAAGAPRPKPVRDAARPSRPASVARPRPQPGRPSRPNSSRPSRPQPARGSRPVRRRPIRPRPALGQPHRRARGLFTLICIVLSLFVAQLFRLQTFDAKSLAEQALAGRVTTAPVGASRGQLLDRNGEVLATSLERYNVTVDQKVVAEYYTYITDPVTKKKVKVTRGPKDAAVQLAKVLKIPVPEVLKTLVGTKRFSYVAKGVSPQTWRAVDALPISGIYPERTTQRFYPADGVAASLLGFVGKDGKALGGLELKLNEELSGKAGKVTYQRDPAGRFIPMTDVAERKAVAGINYQLTLDRDIQWKAEQLLAQKVTETKSESGSVVVMNRQGEILALANAPSFNPNNASAAKPADLSNRALAEVYEPGSTSKIMTAAAVLESGAVTTEDGFSVPDSVSRAGSTFHDSHTHPTERLNLAGILAQSSNVGTVLAGEKISPTDLHSYFTKFGIGQPSGLDFPGESRGILAKPQDWSGSQRYTVMFGQGLSINALQGASVYQTIANDGVRVTPRLIAGTVTEPGKLTPAAPAASSTVVSSKTAQQVRLMLEGVVSEEGTAPLARIPGYRVAGKTGTAERVDPACGCYRGYTSSFIGFAPADKPELIISVTLQDPINGRYGGRIAAPVFHDLMIYALQKLQVPPTGTASPKITLTPGER